MQLVIEDIFSFTDENFESRWARREVTSAAAPKPPSLPDKVDKWGDASAEDCKDTLADVSGVDGQDTENVAKLLVGPKTLL